MAWETSVCATRFFRHRDVDVENVLAQAKCLYASFSNTIDSNKFAVHYICCHAPHLFLFAVMWITLTSEFIGLYRGLKVETSHATVVD